MLVLKEGSLLKSIQWRLIISITVSLLLVLLTAFQWSIIDRTTPFLFLPLAGIIWFGFLIVFGLSLSCLTKLKTLGIKSGIPALIQVITLLAVIFIPFTTLWLKADFWIFKNQRDKVVQKVLSGELIPNVSHNSSLIALNSNYSNISMGGNEIVVEEHDGLKYIFFFTFRGILDNYSGFLFVPDGGNPSNYSDLNEKDSTELVHLDGNWYYASHH